MPPETPEQRRERLYRAEVGDPRNLPDDHPDKWQWDYRGTKAERETLLERLGITPDDDEPPTQEETLW